MSKPKHMGRIHITESELCDLLGYKSGKISFIGWMREYGEIGIVICHPDIPYEVGEDSLIPRIKRR